MDILFVLTHVPDPRINKRLAVARRLGNAAVVCVRRPNQDVYEPAAEGVPHRILDIDLPTGERPFKRLMASVRFAGSALLEAKRMRPQTIYAVSLDSLLIARCHQLFHRQTRIVLEVADVRESYLRVQRGMKRNLLTLIERFLYPHVSLLVLTSERFFEEYYKRYFPESRTLVLHNIPDFSAFEGYQKKQGGPFTVGFIGGIRYLNQMKMLVDAADEAGARVVFAGAGGTAEDMQGIKAYCQGRTHVTFTGKYQYDRDIAKLYGSVDCVYAVYDADNPNVRIALPNKLYEAAYCGLPLIVAKGTYLAEIVTSNGLGVAVSHQNISELVAVLRAMKTRSTEAAELTRRAGAAYLESLPRQDLGTALQKLIAR